MVDTNQLLSIAFSLISGFTNVVHVPSDGVPRNRGDLQKLVVGGLWSPFDLVLVHRHGETFWIRGGIVESYESPVSFFHSQTVDTPEQLKGPPALSSNQVVNLGLDLLRRLGKTGNPAEKIVPKVKSAEPNAPL